MSIIKQNYMHPIMSLNDNNKQSSCIVTVRLQWGEANEIHSFYSACMVVSVVYDYGMCTFLHEEAGM